MMRRVFLTPRLRTRHIHAWKNLADHIPGHEDAPLDRKTARLWELVLSARRVPHRVRRIPGGWEVGVRPFALDRAVSELTLFLAENRETIPGFPPVSGKTAPAGPSIWAIFLLVAFYAACNRVYPGMSALPVHWLELGSANAAAVLDGEWWRLATGLTLHGDAAHIMGNAVIGGVFAWLACARLGSGLAWLLIMVCGIAGNLLNALALGPPHDSIGFSTAVFGAAGLLGGTMPFAANHPERMSLQKTIRSAFVPVAASLGLLALLGAGEDTDLGAHFFGFGAGLFLGLAAGAATARFGRPGQRADRILYALALLLPIAAWGAAWLAA